MTREDAAIVLSILAAGFPHASLDDATHELWTDELERLEDNNIAVKAVRTIIRSGDKLPSLAQIRATYQTIARSQIEESAILVAPAAPRDVPPWVWVWRWCRDNGDDRGFPQQQTTDGYPLVDEMMSHAEYDLAEEAWLEAGSPKPGHPLGEVLSPL